MIIGPAGIPQAPTDPVERKRIVAERATEAGQILGEWLRGHGPDAANTIEPQLFDFVTLLVVHVKRIEGKLEAMKAQLAGSPDGKRRIILPGQA